MLSLPSQKYQHGKNALQNVAGFTPQQQLAHQMAAKNSGGYSALQQQQLQLQQLGFKQPRQFAQLVTTFISYSARDNSSVNWTISQKSIRL